MPEQQVFAGAIVAVGQHRAEVVVKAADVLPALRADRALGLVGRVVGNLGEDGLVQLRHLAPDERQRGGALEQARATDLEQVAEGREDVDMRHQRVANLAAAEAAGPAHDQHHADAVVGQVALHARAGDAVVRGADDQGVLGQAGLGVPFVSVLISTKTELTTVICNENRTETSYLHPRPPPH